MSIGAQGIPFHIQQLIAPSKTSNTMLIDCWDKLSVAEQIEIIKSINMAPDTSTYYGDMYLERLATCIIEKSCIYVKYTFLSMAKHSFRNNNDIFILVMSDRSPIISHMADHDFSMIHCTFSDESIRDFYSFPHEKRLSIVRNSFSSEPIAMVLDYALKNEGTCHSVQELCDIASEYLLCDGFQYYFNTITWEEDDALIQLGFYNGLSNLWQLVPRAPFQLASVLLQHLPPCYDNTYLSHGVVDFLQIDVVLAAKYFFRNDVCDATTRHHVFFNATDWQLRLAAASRCLNLSLDDFTKVLSYPIDVRNEMIAFLLQYDTQELAIANAIFDLLYTLNPRTNSVEQARIWFNKRFDDKSNEYYDDEVIYLRIYRMAHLISVNKNGLDNSDIEPLLHDITIYGDAWATFQNYLKFYISTSAFNFIHVCPEASRLEWKSCHQFARELLPAEFLTTSAATLKTSIITDDASLSVKHGGLLSAIKKIFS
jgi:hypothetical protein